MVAAHSLLSTRLRIFVLQELFKQPSHIEPTNLFKALALHGEDHFHLTTRTRRHLYLQSVATNNRKWTATSKVSVQCQLEIKYEKRPWRFIFKDIFYRVPVLINKTMTMFGATAMFAAFLIFLVPVAIEGVPLSPEDFENNNSQTVIDPNNLSQQHIQILQQHNVNLTELQYQRANRANKSTNSYYPTVVLDAPVIPASNTQNSSTSDAVLETRKQWVPSEFRKLLVRQEKPISAV